MISGNTHPSSLPISEELWQSTLHWVPSATQQEVFRHLFAGILAGNQQMNLTRITEPGEFWEKHLWDSLNGLAPWLSPTLRTEALEISATARVIDIGTGAGFPGLPAAIAFPDWQITLLDATQKKVRFLADLASSLGLDSVRAIRDRAEFLAHQLSHRELYDLALLRAVGAAATCAEYALPLLKVGGVAVLYRGQWTDADTTQLEPVVRQLGGQILQVIPSTTPLTQGCRHCIYLKKQATTSDAFPRSVGIPAKTPLT